jgi:hypothetical protein
MSLQETSVVSWDEHRRAFAETLGVAAPVSDQVLEAALTDSAYAHRLMNARRHPVILQMLLDHPPPPVYAAGMSKLALAQKAAASLARWTAKGFVTVDDATLARRRAACDACEHAQIAAEALAGNLPQRMDDAQCGLCGCNLAIKTRFPHESCPDAHERMPGMTRWGEPIARSAGSPGP